MAHWGTKYERAAERAAKKAASEKAKRSKQTLKAIATILRRNRIQKQREAEREQKEFESFRRRASTTSTGPSLSEKIEQEIATKAYAEQMATLVLAHRTCSDKINWAGVLLESVPSPPMVDRSQSRLAQERLSNYVPSFLDRLFHRSDARRARLVADLEGARLREAESSKQPMAEYAATLARWEAKQQVAARFAAGEQDAFAAALSLTDPLVMLSLDSVRLSTRFPGRGLCVAELRLDSGVIPASYPYPLKRGGVSYHKKSQANLRQESTQHVCSVSIRIAREILAILPINRVIVNTFDGATPKQSAATGGPVLSIALSPELVPDGTWDADDALELVRHMEHRMEFDPKKGLQPVQPLTR